MFSLMKNAALEELHFCQRGQLNAVIAIHNLKLGPALGGCRFISYDSEEDAINDATRLARGMSYKAALAKVPQGGGKSVIIQPKGDFNRFELFKQFAQFIDELSGRYITAMDSGTQVQDMDCIREVTPYVSSSSNIGDPSPSTANGVALGIKTAVNFALGSDLKGVRVAIQGLGHVGYDLANHLHNQGAELLVADIDPSKVKQAEELFGATSVEVTEIHKQQVEVFAPCGLGGAINQQTLPELNCKIVAGCANNQLADSQLGDQLYNMNILYAPDYVINSGGLIFASSRYRGMKDNEIERSVLKLKDTLNTIFTLSKSKNQPTHRIADEMAEQILYG